MSDPHSGVSPRDTSCVVSECHPGLESLLVDDDESGTSRVLAGLTQTRLFSQLGEDTRGVQVVDPSLEETGSQSQRQHLLRLQLQPKPGLTHPGEGAVELRGLRAGNGRKGKTRSCDVNGLTELLPGVCRVTACV